MVSVSPSALAVTVSDSCPKASAAKSAISMPGVMLRTAAGSSSVSVSGYRDGCPSSEAAVRNALTADVASRPLLSHVRTRQ